MSRPSEFTQGIADTICELIADGKSLRSICLAVEMPCKSTVFKWLAANATFADQYARAREAQADTYFEDSVDIADDGTRDYSADPQGGMIVNHDHIQRAKLRVDTRKWAAGKLKPKKYGDRVDLTHASPDGSPLVFQVVNYASDPNTVPIPAQALSAAGAKGPGSGS